MNISEVLLEKGENWPQDNSQPDNKIDMDEEIITYKNRQYHFAAKVELKDKRKRLQKYNTMVDRPSLAKDSPGKKVTKEKKLYTDNISKSQVVDQPMKTQFTKTFSNKKLNVSLQSNPNQVSMMMTGDCDNVKFGDMKLGDNGMSCGGFGHYNPLQEQFHPKQASNSLDKGSSNRYMQKKMMGIKKSGDAGSSRIAEHLKKTGKTMEYMSGMIFISED